MRPDEVEEILASCEAALAAGHGDEVRDLGFWRAVSGVKRDPALVAAHADRIGEIDQALFRSWAPVTLPLGVGTAGMLVASAVGLVLVGAAYGLDSPWNGLSFLAGLGVLLAATHGLGHLEVGRLVGIRFTAWFVRYTRPQPGVKTDYASYLRAPARSRAWMHASGALVTKVVPFLLLPAALIAGIPGWAVVAVVAIGALQILTDVLWSVRTSDWKRFRREMRIAAEIDVRP